MTHESLPPAAYYHALLLGTQNNIRMIATWRKQCTGWREAWEKHSLSLFGRNDPEALWEGLLAQTIDLLLPSDPRYPPILREMRSPPYGMYVRGNLPVRGAHAIAVVGTRRATESGIKTATHFSSALAGRGVSIISGLALGIDAASHRGALSAGGHTVAVLAHGLHEFNPRVNARLAEEILASGGAIVSEYPPGTPSFPNQFVARNRIVSGLSRGTLIIEAPCDSGALHTAYFAVDDNRDVFVVPGPITYPNFIGSHGLIRNGAELVTCPEDILESWNMAEHEATLPLPIGTEYAPGNKGDGAEQATSVATPKEKVFALMGARGEPLEIDKISKLINLDIQSVAHAITLLELDGLIEETNQGYEISNRRVTNQSKNHR